MSAIGRRTPRRDSLPKVRGATRYAADQPVAGVLHARLVLAHEAHALVRGLRTETAAAHPGVVAVLTAADLPIRGEGKARMYEPLAREEVVYTGQPVAIVVAESEAIAEDAAELVEVELEPIEAVLDLETAARPGAPRARLRSAAEGEGADLSDMHTSVSAGDLESEELSANVLGTARLHHGDVASELAASHIVVRRTFHTPWVHQGYLEPQAATAWVDPDGDLVLSTATQAPFATRDQIARLFDRPAGSVRVMTTPLGGAFGGKIMIIEPLVAGAALALRRPVRLAMTRSEDLSATNPAGGEVIALELGADAEGTFTAVRARVLVDRGATADYGVEGAAALLASGPYRWRAHELVALGVATNRVTFGAYRAPTAAPAAFALESLVDELAGRLDLDPLELRLRNVAEEGDPGASGEPYPVFGARACLERLREHRVWTGRRSLPEGEGVGVAAGWWPGGYEPAAAVCRLDADGQLTVVTGAADMTGVGTGFAAIAAEAFGLAPESVRVVFADTSTAPYAGASGGSKITYTVGRAVERAAAQARDLLLEVAAEELEIDPADLEIADGAVQPRGNPAMATPVPEIAAKILDYGSPYAPVEGHGRVTLPEAPQASAQLSHVRVDRETGRITVLGQVIAQDVGRALNPALVEGQMHGGAAQGLGWALLEELHYDADGQLVTGTFVDYALPTMTDVPAIATEIVEVPAPEGPFGAKGVGEAPVVAAAAAVANAVTAATGVRLDQLPMTPERVWRAMATSAASTSSSSSRPAGDRG